MSRVDFVHVHHSGLWDANARHWAALIEQAFKGGADVLTLTEFTQSPLPASWFHSRGLSIVHFTGVGRSEGAIITLDDTFVPAHPMDTWCLPVSTTPFALGKGTIRPRTHVTGARYTHIATGKDVVFEVLHTPSAIEGIGRLLDARRSKAMLECLAAILRHQRGELKGENYVLSADWNLDLKKVWVRTLLRARLRGLRNAWRKLPKGGSHGHRLIDGARFFGRLVAERGGSHLLPPVPGFDHRGVQTAFSFR